MYILGDCFSLPVQAQVNYCKSYLGHESAHWDSIFHNKRGYLWLTHQTATFTTNWSVASNLYRSLIECFCRWCTNSRIYFCGWCEEKAPPWWEGMAMINETEHTPVTGGSVGAKKRDLKSRDDSKNSWEPRYTACFMPYTLFSKVEAELQCLEKDSILEPVHISHWVIVELLQGLCQEF